MNPLAIRKNNFISGTLLVIGTSIGAGMLGLPVETAQMGFVPVCASYLLCWAVMTLSAILFLQLQSRVRAKGNISSMACLTIGKSAATVVEALFALLYYALLIAYLKAFVQSIENMFPFFKFYFSRMSAVAFFAFCILFKNNGIKKVNSALVFGLIITYALIVISGATHIQTPLLLQASWQRSIFSIPLIITAFGFHVIIPSLYHHQGEDLATTRLSILTGTTITLLIYLTWQAVVVGIVPLQLLIEAHRMDQTAVVPMSKVLQVPFLSVAGKLFSIFALASSCLGVSVAFYDFMVDKLHISDSHRSKIGLLFLIFVPPLIIASLNIQIFYLALRYGGGFGVLLLLVALPVGMTLSQKKREDAERNFPLCRREKLVIATLLIFCLVALAANGILLSK